MFESNLEIKEDEFADEKGLPVCKKCKQPRYIKIEDFGVRRCVCECQKAENERLEFERKQEELKQKAKELKSMTLLGKRYENVTFDNSIIEEDNKKAYEIIKNYATKYNEMFKNGYGIYVYGETGVGKTHLLACLCNYLTDHLQSCIFTNFINIANDIKSVYDNGQSEDFIISKYSKVKYLFIDDLGKESFKKLLNSNNNAWLDEKIYHILNNRYNNMLPTIFSSNHSIKDMSSEFGFDKATMSRIISMSTFILKMNGEDKRVKYRDNQSLNMLLKNI